MQYGSKNIISKIKVLEMGIAFYKKKKKKKRDFPNCPPATSQIGNSLMKTSVITVKNCCSNGPFKMNFRYFFLVLSSVNTLNSKFG